MFSFKNNFFFMKSRIFCWNPWMRVSDADAPDHVRLCTGPNYKTQDGVQDPAQTFNLHLQGYIKWFLLDFLHLFFKKVRETFWLFSFVDEIFEWFFVIFLKMNNYNFWNFMFLKKRESFCLELPSFSSQGHSNAKLSSKMTQEISYLEDPVSFYTLIVGSLEP